MKFTIIMLNNNLVVGTTLAVAQNDDNRAGASPTPTVIGNIVGAYNQNPPYPSFTKGGELVCNRQVLDLKRKQT